MLLKIDEIEKEYKSDREGLSELINFLDDYLDNSPNILTGFKVDGEEVYEDLGEFLSPRLKKVKEIKAITETPEDYLKGMLISSYDYMDNGKALVSSLASNFYRGFKEEDFQRLTDLTHGLAWLIESTEIIDKNQALLSGIEDREAWNRFYAQIVSLGGILSNIIKALERKDMILVADYLKYEVLKVFGEAIGELNIILS